MGAGRGGIHGSPAPTWAWAYMPPRTTSTRRASALLPVAVVSSGLMGTINGSGVANVVTTGQFTIPLMKRFGYSPAFAGGVGIVGDGTARLGVVDTLCGEQERRPNSPPGRIPNRFSWGQFSSGYGGGPLNLLSSRSGL